MEYTLPKQIKQYQTLREVQKEYIEIILKEFKGDITAACKVSKIARATMYRLISVHGLDIKCFRLK